MKVCILDNTDSFTWNLYHYFDQIDDIQVSIIHENNGKTDDFEQADAVVLSPGPGLPLEHPFMMEILMRTIEHKPILGVCLGLQAIVEFEGGTLQNLGTVWHGVSQETQFNKEEKLFEGIESPIMTAHYHSWIAAHPLPSSLKEIATGPNETIMAIKHIRYPVYGIQFHPESILTPNGIEILKNFIQLCRK